MTHFGTLLAHHFLCLGKNIFQKGGVRGGNGCGLDFATGVRGGKWVRAGLQMRITDLCLMLLWGLFLCTDLGARMVPKGFPLGVTLGTLFMFVGVRFGVPVDASMLTSFGEPSGRENVVFSMEWLSKINVWAFQKK